VKSLSKFHREIPLEGSVLRQYNPINASHALEPG